MCFYWFDLVKLTHVLEIVYMYYNWVIFMQFSSWKILSLLPPPRNVLSYKLLVQCIGPWLGQSVIVSLNSDFFFSPMKMCLAISLFWRNYQIQSWNPDVNALLPPEQLHVDKSISKNKCPPISKTCLISARSTLNPVCCLNSV